MKRKKIEEEYDSPEWIRPNFDRIDKYFDFNSKWDYVSKKPTKVSEDQIDNYKDLEFQCVDLEFYDAIKGYVTELLFDCDEELIHDLVFIANYLPQGYSFEHAPTYAYRYKRYILDPSVKEIAGRKKAAKSWAEMNHDLEKKRIRELHTLQNWVRQDAPELQSITLFIDVETKIQIKSQDLNRRVLKCLKQEFQDENIQTQIEELDRIKNERLTISRAHMRSVASCLYQFLEKEITHGREVEVIKKYKLILIGYILSCATLVLLEDDYGDLYKDYLKRDLERNDKKEFPYLNYRDYLRQTVKGLLLPDKES